MFRVYDKIAKTWIIDGIYLSPNDKISTTKNAIFGKKKKFFVSDDRYVYHRDIGLLDCNKELIYEGDIVEVKLNGDKDNKGINMLVTYSPDIAAYVLLNFNGYKYYSLGVDKCKYIKVIGNVFDNLDLLPKEAYKE